MIQMRINHSTMKGSASMNDHTIICTFNISTHTFQILNHYCNTVRFFNLQFLRIPNHCGTFCESSHHCDHWNLINQCRNNLTFYGSAMEGTGADQQVSNRFALVTFVEKCNISSHIHTNFQKSCSGRVNSYIFQKNLAVRCQKPCCNKISSRRNISGNFDFPSFKNRLRLYRSSSAFRVNFCPKII